MFERNRIDTSQEVAASSVVVELDDGRRAAGKILFPRSKSLLEILNGPAQFVEFIPLDGEPQAEMIAKSSIRSLRAVATPSAARLRTATEFDPYEILGLETGADRTTVRQAFHSLSKRYHPDTYAAAGLPDEVVEYLETMARRVNAAYELLSVEVTVAERQSARRTAPVYEKANTATRV